MTYLDLIMSLLWGRYPESVTFNEIWTAVRRNAHLLEEEKREAVENNDKKEIGRNIFDALLFADCLDFVIIERDERDRVKSVTMTVIGKEKYEELLKEGKVERGK